MTGMEEFLFDDLRGRRNRTERLHDMLVVAKKGLKRTRILSGANLSWAPMMDLFKEAQEAGLIEEIPAPSGRRWYRKGQPDTVWKTTEKGLKYVRSVYDASKLLRKSEA